MSVPDPASPGSAGHAIRLAVSTLAVRLVDREFELRPELEQRFGQRGRLKAMEDARYDLLFLSQALLLGSPELFAKYMEWTASVLNYRGLGRGDLEHHLQCTTDVLREQLSFPEYRAASEYITSAMAALDDATEPASHMPAGATLAQSYLQALLRGQRQEACRMILLAVEQGSPVSSIYLDVIQPVQREIGRLWQKNLISVAQEHYATACTQLAIAQLYPKLATGEASRHTLVAASVSGDLHELGARMVSDFFEMKGWRTFYLGANMPSADLIRHVAERDADVLALSVTMAYHIEEARDLIARLRSSPCGARVRVLVGGYALGLVPDLWRQIGADGYAPDAQAAVECAERLVLTDSAA